MTESESVALPLGDTPMAPEVGLEPTTDRLTADCSTTELLPHFSNDIIISLQRCLSSPCFKKLFFQRLTLQSLHLSMPLNRNVMFNTLPDTSSYVNNFLQKYFKSASDSSFVCPSYSIKSVFSYFIFFSYSCCFFIKRQ